MKTVIALTVIVMIALVTIAMHKPEVESEEKVGLQVITALQRGSAHEISALYPTVADFHALMIRNSELYGKNLQEAARDFQKEFDAVLSPAFRDSFENVRSEGERLGIDWRTAKLKSVEVPGTINADYSVVPMTITFDAQGTEYRIRISKALLMNGRWKISQYMILEK